MSITSNLTQQLPTNLPANPNPNIPNYNISKTYSSSNEIFPTDPNWSKEIKAYEINHKTLQWGTTIKPHVYNQKEQCQKENIFNPISQKYYDKNYDNQLKSYESSQIKSKITQFYDNELRKEQTFNILSLKDRLKGFENHPNYPKESKQKEKLNKETSKVPYNILSNLDKKTLTLSTEPTLPTKSTLGKYQAFNVITNEYIVNNKLKKSTELEIDKLTAAKKLQQTRSDYDYIRGIFYDSEKQKRYEMEQKELQKQRCQMKNELMFNPVNHHVYDKERMEIHDHIKDNLKKRYTLKPVINEYYLQKDLEKDYKKERQIENKLNYNRYKVEDQRGYNVINMKNNYSNIKDSLNCCNKKDSWETLKLGASENETFSKKGFYKDPYDISSIDQNEHQYKQKRESCLKELGNYCEEIKMKKVNEKFREFPKVEIKEREVMDKKKWFSTGKSVDLMDYRRDKKIPSTIAN